LNCLTPFAIKERAASDFLVVEAESVALANLHNIRKDQNHIMINSNSMESSKETDAACMPRKKSATL